MIVNDFIIFPILLFSRRAVGDRATEPRIAPMKFNSNEEKNKLKELNLKKIKPKPEAKPIMQSLREGLENLKKPSTVSTGKLEDVNNKKSETGNFTSTTTSQIANGILERIGKLRQAAGRNRNPAKKSASFTFAVRPEIALRNHKYSSLEPAESNQQSSQQVKSQQEQANKTKNTDDSRQPVQRSVSTSVLEMEQPPVVELPDYSRVRDSVAPPSPTRSMLFEDELSSENQIADEIYAEICETKRWETPVQKKVNNRTSVTELVSPENRVMAKIKLVIKEEPRNDNSCYIMPTERKYVNSVFVSNSDTIEQKKSSRNFCNDDNIIYNAVY